MEGIRNPWEQTPSVETADTTGRIVFAEHPHIIAAREAGTTSVEPEVFAAMELEPALHQMPFQENIDPDRAIQLYKYVKGRDLKDTNDIWTQEFFANLKSLSPEAQETLVNTIFSGDRKWRDVPHLLKNLDDLQIDRAALWRRLLDDWSTVKFADTHFEQFLPHITSEDMRNLVEYGHTRPVLKNIEHYSEGGEGEFHQQEVVANRRQLVLQILRSGSSLDTLDVAAHLPEVGRYVEEYDASYFARALNNRPNQGGISKLPEDPATATLQDIANEAGHRRHTDAEAIHNETAKANLPKLIETLRNPEHPFANLVFTLDKDLYRRTVHDRNISLMDTLSDPNIVDIKVVITEEEGAHGHHNRYLNVVAVRADGSTSNLISSNILRDIFDQDLTEDRLPETIQKLKESRLRKD